MVRILTVNDQVSEYVGKIKAILDGVVLEKPLAHNELRYTVDESADSLGKKIRRATEMKIPAVLIVGPKDVEAGEVSIRLKDKEEKVKLEELGSYLKKI
jgi:threonyl-tRNA synthetase